MKNFRSRLVAVALVRTVLVAVGLIGFCPHLRAVEIAPASTAPAAASLIRLRETKMKGTHYECRLIASLEGRGNMDGFTVIEGGAHFFYQTELEWQSEILENDGVTLVERRRFKTSAGTAVLSVTEFGLTARGSDLASGGLSSAIIAAGATTGMGWIPIAVGELSRSDRLLKVPVVGSYLRSVIKESLDQYGPNQALNVATKTLGNLKGTELILTWKNGKLDGYKVVTPGVVLSPQSIACATRAAAFLDVNIFPETQKLVGENWSVAAKDVADYFNAEPDLTDSADGLLKITRAPDELANEIATLNGQGSVTYSGEKYAASCSVSTLDAKFHYGRTGAGKNQYLSYCRSIGKASIDKMEAGNVLFGLRITTQPSYEVVYDCRQK